MEHISIEFIYLIRDCPLFMGLRQEELSLLLSSSSSRIRSFTKGELVAQAGDEIAFMHILVSGHVKGEMVDFTGKVIKIEDIEPPRPLAPAFLFGKQNRYPVNITAGVDVKILSIPRDEFLKMMQTSEQVLRNFVNIVSSRGQFLSNKIRFLSFTTIKGKLAQYLLDLAGKSGEGPFQLPHSQAQLSELFGVARPSVGRAISEMNQEEIIRTEGKIVHILNVDKLSELLK
ncbi:MAG: Crp/Fnr family transcriptional regulator [Bacteroidota bacterium]